MKVFQAFRLDTTNQCLWRGEERVPIPPKAYDVLSYLVENPGRLVTPDELLEKLWPESYVNPEVFRKYILDIRKILGDRPDRPEFIETVTKREHRFIAPVIDESATPPPDLATQDELTLGAGASEEKEPSRILYLLKLASIPILAVVVAGATAGLAMAYRALSRDQDSNAALAELIAKHDSDWAYQIAQAYAFRGESGKSLEWLERAYKQRNPGLPSIKTDPLLENLRHDQRYTDLLKKMHLPT
jgi:DNA-binding winged helix-turn-helix (wHTH) protein